ncbi:hypothetical protein LCGC14_2039100 [marine sediment metagenome]|uniref:Uncharacterized protein n=1 Tax=marine sediment metagenome TaxID=412755 RepID=A0A0F9HPG4_9ZZZZ
MAVDGDVSSPSPSGGETLDGIMLSLSAHIYYSGGGTSLSLTSLQVELLNITRNHPITFNLVADPPLGGFPWVFNPSSGIDIEPIDTPSDLNQSTGDTGGDEYSWYLACLGVLDGSTVIRWNSVNNGPYLFTSGDGTPSKPTNPIPTNTDTGIVLLPTLSWQAG